VQVAEAPKEPGSQVASPNGAQAWHQERAVSPGVAVPGLRGMVVGLQSRAGNAAVARMISGVLRRPDAAAVGVIAQRAARRPVVQRDEPSDQQDPQIKRLRELNGMAMGPLLAALENEDRDELRPKIGSAGIDVPRMEMAFTAHDERGADARDFAFDHYFDLRALKYRDQRDDVLRFVDPAFVPPKKLMPGAVIKIDGLAAVVHRGHIRKQKSVGDGVPWIAYNPGAVGNGPSFKSPGGYGTTIGPAAINIYASEAEGVAGLVAWIDFWAKRNTTFWGFFGVHAPAEVGDQPGNRGNDPQAYFDRVARQMGLDPNDPKVAGQKLSAQPASAVAAAILAVGEGYKTRPGETLTWPEDAARLDRETWFAMMYWETTPSGQG
jgi:hypothetical protein